jgi:predicted GNAT superfamily acetyltransferase
VNLRPENPRSLAFHARQGFREAGRLEVSDGRLVALLERPLR